MISVIVSHLPSGGGEAVSLFLKKLLAGVVNLLWHIIDILLGHFLVGVVEIVPNALYRYAISTKICCHATSVIMDLK